MDKTLLFIVNPRAGKTKSSAPLFDAVATFGRAGYLVRVMLTQPPGTPPASPPNGAGTMTWWCAPEETAPSTRRCRADAAGKPPAGGLSAQRQHQRLCRQPADPLLRAAGGPGGGGGHPPSPGPGGPQRSVFLLCASFGAFTKASYSASQETKNALGHFAYILEGIKNLDSLRPYRCGVEADGESFDGDFIFGAVCNSTSLGGLVKLDPKRVHMDDGMFELILLRMPKTALDLQNLITALNRMDYDYPGVIFRHVRSVTVTTREDIPWSLDGEYAPSAPRVEIRNLHSAVQLMIQDDE